MRSLFRTFVAASLAILSLSAISLAPATVTASKFFDISTSAVAGSWPGMITDAGTNPAYKASTVGVAHTCTAALAWRPWLLGSDIERELCSKGGPDTSGQGGAVGGSTSASPR